jgi:hypothetical protein
MVVEDLEIEEHPEMQFSLMVAAKLRSLLALGAAFAPKLKGIAKL